MQPPTSVKTIRVIHLARARTAAPHGTAQAQESRPTMPIKKPRDPAVTIPAAVPHVTSQDQESRPPNLPRRLVSRTGIKPPHKTSRFTNLGQGTPTRTQRNDQEQEHTCDMEGTPAAGSTNRHLLTSMDRPPQAPPPPRLHWSPLPGAHLFTSPSRPAWKRTRPQGSNVV